MNRVRVMQFRVRQAQIVDERRAGFCGFQSRRTSFSVLVENEMVVHLMHRCGRRKKSNRIIMGEFISKVETDHVTPKDAALVVEAELLRLQRQLNDDSLRAIQESGGDGEYTSNYLIFRPIPDANKKL